MEQYCIDIERQWTTVEYLKTYGYKFKLSSKARASTNLVGILM